MHDLSGFRTPDPSIQATVDLWLRPDGYGDRQAYALCEGKVNNSAMANISQRLNYRHGDICRH